MKGLVKLNSLFICFEGIDGAGKSTLIPLVKEHLVERGKIAISFIENEIDPFREPLQRIWRNGISGNRTKKELEYATACILAGGRAFLQAQYIDEASKHFEVVLIERWFWSGMAYQSAWGVSPSEILKLNLSTGVQIPDLTIILDVSPKVALERIANRKKIDIKGIENLFVGDLKNLDRLRKVFVKIAKNYGNKGVHLIDNNKSIEEGMEQILFIFKKFSLII